MMDERSRRRAEAEAAGATAAAAAGAAAEADAICVPQAAEEGVEVEETKVFAVLEADMDGGGSGGCGERRWMGRRWARASASDDGRHVWAEARAAAAAVASAIGAMMVIVIVVIMMVVIRVSVGGHGGVWPAVMRQALAARDDVVTIISRRRPGRGAETARCHKIGRASCRERVSSPV